MSVRTEIDSPGDLGKAVANRERGFATAFKNAQLARLKRGEHRNVLRINAELTVRPGSTTISTSSE